MKQFILLIAICLTGLYTQAQTPIRENNALIIETSAAWCGPCGNWGTMFYGQMIADPYTAYHTMFVTIHPNYGDSKDSNELNYTLFSKVCDDWGQVVDPWTMFPMFSNNFIDYMAAAANAGIMYNNMMDARDTFLSHDPIASVGFTFKRTGNKFDITTRTRFWQDVTGDYYVGAYLVEDSVLHEQSGSANPLDTMRYVMRTSMSTSGSSWGDQVVTGSAKMYQFVNKSFSYTVTDPSWDVTKMKPVVVIYKKTGSTYTYVNGNNVATATSPDPTGIAEIAELAQLSISPNPANDFTNIVLNTKNALTGNIIVTNQAGQIVYSTPQQNFNTGTNTIKISTGNLASGFYTVIINSDNGSIAKPLIIAR